MRYTLGLGALAALCPLFDFLTHSFMMLNYITPANIHFIISADIHNITSANRDQPRPEISGYIGSKL